MAACASRASVIDWTSAPMWRSSVTNDLPVAKLRSGDFDRRSDAPERMSGDFFFLSPVSGGWAPNTRTGVNCSAERCDHLVSTPHPGSPTPVRPLGRMSAGARIEDRGADDGADDAAGAGNG